ncbi:MAG TPA: prenyltransferase/squalene oxidase repeat-containing protein [Solirubrobacteraceae bacterium]|nr:prenyltransferase/squalene oxidase repeat-containing protein [Solirubrobacteraceae bacterium]
MSWPLASFAIVGVVLALGWLAYERARPSARMIAVVGTLAAVAALGRDAFVALPDVKPITAMTLVVGYALGPLPGFSVGALGMLASNFVLGQGPYTPWQMAAWGLVGLAGAALGAVSRRRLGRVQLALACALAAFAAKQVMDLYTWTLGASHTPAAYLAIAATALPFDLTDTIASFFFGLAFGPELARLLARMRARMHVSWQDAGVGEQLPPPSEPDGRSGGRSGARAGVLGPIGAIAPPLVLLIALLAVLATPRAASAASLGRELSYLSSAQNADGGFGAAAGQRSSELYTGWSAIGLAAAGRNPASFRRAGRSVLDGLRAEAATLDGLGDDERTILALSACGASAYSFGGRNLVAEVLHERAGDGSFAHQVNLTAFAIFALRAVGHSAKLSAIREAAGWIERQQNGDGGFGFGGRGSPSDVDDTAAALQALADAGARDRRALSRATAFLVGAQNPDGGFPQQRGGESNAQSSAWAVQGLLAAGRDPASVKRSGSRSPLGYLESLLAPNGSIRYSRTSAQTPVWVTAQVLTALARKTFPVA